MLFEKLKYEISLSYVGAFFEGLKNGLSLQSAVLGSMFCWLLFAPATVNTVCFFIGIGALGIGLHCALALIQCYYYSNNETQSNDLDITSELKKIFRSQDDIVKLEEAMTAVDNLQEHLVSASDEKLRTAPQLGIVEFEIGRVAVAGFKKGSKAGEEIDDLWDVFRSPEYEGCIHWAKLFLTCTFVFSFAARTLAKSYATNSATPVIKSSDSNELIAPDERVKNSSLRQVFVSTDNLSAVENGEARIAGTPTEYKKRIASPAVNVMLFPIRRHAEGVHLYDNMYHSKSVCVV